MQPVLTEWCQQLQRDKLTPTKSTCKYGNFDVCISAPTKQKQEKAVWQCKTIHASVLCGLGGFASGLKDCQGK